MSNKVLAAPGVPVELERIAVPRAKEVAQFLKAESLPYATLVECRKQSGADVVVLDVEVEVGQKRVHDIRRIERLAIVFDVDDRTMPEVLSLRGDFPSVPHINLRAEEFPRSLCLYDQLYRDIKRRWTAAAFIERIRTWLAQTAKGKLHGEDQPLEPLLVDAAVSLVIPAALFAGEEQHETLEKLAITGVQKHGKLVLIANRWTADTSRQGLQSVAIALKCKPQTHGIVRKKPATLSELHDFMMRADFNLLTTLRERFQRWISDNHILDSHLILIAWLPKRRSETSTVEATEIWAFISEGTIAQVGEDIGVWKIHAGQPGLLLAPDENQRGNTVNLDLLNPTLTLSRSTAANLNSLDKGDSRKIAAVGAGALGSQVAMNLVRAGYGKWTLIDDDYLLPHNLARNELGGFAIGFPKAYALAEVANQIIDGEDIATPIVADVVESGRTETELNRALTKADMIVDLSASITVARHLTHNIQSNARRISLFLNPSGTDLVVLAEDEQRQLRLDHLEMQYYRELITRSELAEHLHIDSRAIRYAQSCRDLTNKIPQDFVSLHSAIASRVIRSIADNETAFITIWKIDSQDMSVTPVRTEPAHPVKPTLMSMRDGEKWCVYTDSKLLEEIKSLRQEKLPNETGGILIGSFDLQRKIVYVIDTLPSPQDSVEKPMLYIRGSQELPEQVNEIGKKTAGMLEYVGEWHSHPDGRNCSPSNDDYKLFSHLKQFMHMDGLPALMMISGSQGQCCWLLESMPLQKNY